jgi:hypothetical protein
MSLLGRYLLKRCTSGEGAAPPAAADIYTSESDCRRRRQTPHTINFDSGAVRLHEKYTRSSGRIPEAHAVLSR